MTTHASPDPTLAPPPVDEHPDYFPAELPAEDGRGPAPSPWRRAVRALSHGRGLVGAVLVGGIVLLGLIGPLLVPFGPSQQIDGANLLPPNGRHWLGTDEVNRDIFSRLVHGIRVDLLVIFGAVPVGALLGIAIGLATAWHRATDVIGQRFFDLVLAFPALILAIALSALLGPGAFTIAVVIVVAEVPIFGRLARTSLRSIRELPYVEAATVVGAGPGWVLRRHVLPNATEPLVVQLALSMSVAVFIDAAMSFLGLGVQPPQPSVGSLIRDGMQSMYDSPWFVVGPLAVVVVLVLGLLLISQALVEADRD